MTQGMPAGLRPRPGTEPWTALADDELLTRARAGDTAAFAELYHRHRPAARRLARRVGRGRVEVDDVVAETFTRVLHALRAGGGPVYGFRVYLLTAVRRTAWYLENRAGREVAAEPTALDQRRSEPDPVLASVERGMVAMAFASLPERWRTVLWHTVVEGEPARRVASIFGVSPNSVAALSYRARNALAAAYLQAHVAEPPAPACREVAGRLGLFATGRCRGRDRERVAAHLARCAECRGRAAELPDVGGSGRAGAGGLPAPAADDVADRDDPADLVVV
ncbi:MAG TPA: sigma-70 family RNA polymerase sigma factor [Mycobacteriales bacterium]|nr:sigma-70 family RNA polymerase sigma factor [Mycobacteriales bacterium]